MFATMLRKKLINLMMALEEIEEQATAMGVDFPDITMVRSQYHSDRCQIPVRLQ
jgi:hypothetical protein